MMHPCDLAERVGKLLFDAMTSDMTLVVEGKHLPAHRAILIASCEYFRALLQGNMMESLQNEIVLEKVPLRGFKLLMRYIYTGQLMLEELDEETILEALQIANLFLFEKLEIALCQYLGDNLSIENVCAIYSKAHSLRIEELREKSFRLMIENPISFLKSGSFCDLSDGALCEVLSKDTFCAEEYEIFVAVARWWEEQPAPANISKFLALVRLPLIDAKDLVTRVRDSGLISADRLLDALQAKECRAADLNFRGLLRSDQNLAETSHGALRLTARYPGDYVTARTCAGYDSEDMPPPDSEIEFEAGTGLTVALSEPFFINHILFVLCDDAFRCAYYVEVSVDLVHWLRVIDYSEYTCHSRQNLYFEPRVVRYIRLVGAWTDEDKVIIKLKNFEASHTSENFKLCCGFYAPEENVATALLGTAVIKSLGQCNALIKEQPSEDPEKSHWTNHEVGGGSITIRFPQPYTVGSMRMLLRSDDSRAYLYYIETCVRWGDWTRVVDHTDGLCRSWQDIVFEARPVRYIRIVGTASTVGKLFSCARFECPATRKDCSESPASGKVSSSDSPYAF